MYRILVGNLLEWPLSYSIDVAQNRVQFSVTAMFTGLKVKSKVVPLLIKYQAVKAWGRGNIAPCILNFWNGWTCVVSYMVFRISSGVLHLIGWQISTSISEML
jgi:hypothetical protein